MSGQLCLLLQSPYVPCSKAWEDMCWANSAVCDLILRAFALGLNLPEDFFQEETDNSQARLAADAPTGSQAHCSTKAQAASLRCDQQINRSTAGPSSSSLSSVPLPCRQTRWVP